MKKLLIFLLFVYTPAAFAQYTAPSLDTYSGYNGVPCSNSNTAFSIVQVAQNKLLCTPAGHALFTRGPFLFDIGGGLGTDETSTGYNTYEVAKYGSSANWFAPEMAALKNLGWNTLPTYAANSALPMVAATKLPFILFEPVGPYSIINKLGWGSGPAKDMIDILSATWAAYTPFSGIPDYRDLNWASMITGELANDTNATRLVIASTATKGYLIGISADDSDSTHCFGAAPANATATGAGTNFATQPPGNNDFRCGYIPLFIPPVVWASSKYAQIYTDGTVYWKKRQKDLLTATYGTVGALNTSWGSTYTTLLTSGTCFGSLMPSWICPLPSAAASLGTGDGVTVTFTATLNTTVSKRSVYIARAGVIVGGDTGAGTIYGTGCGGLTGTINYGTGALSVTCTTAPTAGQAITSGYIQNGWGIGTGLMDEDARVGHSAWVGTGSSDDATNLTNLPQNVRNDVNSYTQDVASFYSSTLNTAYQAWAAANGFTGHVLFFGPTQLGTWSTPPDKYVVLGFCGNVDGWMYGGQGTFTQAELDFVNTNCPGIPLIESEYRTSNAQSIFSWPGSSCTHSGATVNCTVVAANKFTNGVHIDTTCDNVDYNGSNRIITFAANVVTYTLLSGAPSEASAVCNVFYDDANVGGFASQSARCSDFQTKVSALPTRSYTATGIRPYLGFYWWDWFDNWSEQLNWGVETTRGNPYNGSDDTATAQGCSSLNGSVGTCGGEYSQHSPPLGNCTSLIQATSTSIDQQMLSISGVVSLGRLP